MEPRGFIPVFDSDNTLVEIDIRGRFIMMAVDVEFTLLHIMMFCAPDPQHQLRRFNSEEMRMHNKIECTIADLKKYKPHYYEEYKDELAKLWEFKTVRNDLAHLKLTIKAGQKSKFEFFQFYFIQDNENGEDSLFYKDYTMEYFKEILKKFTALEMTLATLAERLKAEIPPYGTSF